MVRENGGDLAGAAAVIDKDYASSLLAVKIGAELLIISTAVDAVYLNYGQPNQRVLSRMTVRQAEAFLREGQFAPGSMEPKIRAAIQCLNRGVQQVIITSPEQMVAAVRGERGTRVLPG